MLDNPFSFGPQGSTIKDSLKPRYPLLVALAVNMDQELIAEIEQALYEGWLDFHNLVEGLSLCEVKPEAVPAKGYSCFGELPSSTPEMEAYLNGIDSAIDGENYPDAFPRESLKFFKQDREGLVTIVRCPRTNEPKPEPKQKVNTMSNLITSNQTALTQAAQIKVGATLNAAAIAALKKSKAVPMMLRGYLDTPFAPIVIANLANLASNYTANQKAKKAVDLMMLSAAVQLTTLVDLEGMVAALIDNPEVSKALAE